MKTKKKLKKLRAEPHKAAFHAAHDCRGAAWGKYTAAKKVYRDARAARDVARATYNAIRDACDGDGDYATRAAPVAAWEAYNSTSEAADAAWGKYTAAEKVYRDAVLDIYYSSCC